MVVKIENDNTEEKEVADEKTEEQVFVIEVKHILIFTLLNVVDWRSKSKAAMKKLKNKSLMVQVKHNVHCAVLDELEQKIFEDWQNLIQKLHFDSQQFLEPIQVFLNQAKIITTDSLLVSALCTCGEYSGA